MMIIRLLGSPWPRYIPLSNKGDPRITLLYFKANYHYKISEISYTCTVVQVLWIRMPLSRIACWHNSSESWHPCIRNQLQFGFSLWLQRQSIRPVSFPQRSGIMKKLVTCSAMTLPPILFLTLARKNIRCIVQPHVNQYEIILAASHSFLHWTTIYGGIAVCPRLLGTGAPNMTNTVEEQCALTTYSLSAEQD